ncbi:MAG: gliding motility-associated C-terminal domain-containing protein [Prevotellaceae bacterium]|jgi:hypothetical protein|nr:gliding motility-associated C-terminal domain-containing protein [Prevotellaceae bacterium]
MINIKAVNRNILSILLCMILFFSFAGKLCAQGISTQGTDFWLSFGKNSSHSYINVDLQVRIVTSDAATVKLTYTFDNTEINVNISAGSVYTYSFTETERLKLYSDATGTTGKSLHIESDVPVSVYALNQHSASADATNVLPVGALGTDYYHISYRSLPYQYNGYIVIATENNTGIYEDGILQDILQKGQVYSSFERIVGVGLDLTGQHITSNKPIAYFVTTSSVQIPLSTGAADCFYEQLVPVNKWGNNFLVPVTHRGVERIRIIASQDGTVITQTGGVIKTDNGGYSQNSLNLNRGQFVELEASLTGCGCYISSNKPVGVCTYLTGKDYLPLLTVNTGDPAIAWVPPVEQSINGTLIAPFVPDGQTYMDEHYALIVTPTASKNLTTVATGTNPATALTGGSWCDNAASGLSFYSLPLVNLSDAYYISNPHGLTVMGYGIGFAESYYYLAGAAMRNLDAAFYVNDIHYQDLDGVFFCDTVVDFRALLQYALTSASGYLRWYIDGTEQTAVTNTLEWTRSLPTGVHTVDIKVVSMDNDTITLSATFGVALPYYDTITATICLGEYYVDDNFDTIQPTQAGFTQYDTAYASSTGCDSIFTLNLTVENCIDSCIYNPISLSYSACPDVAITMGFTAVSGIQYYWYDAQIGGNIVAGGNNSLTLTVIKGSAADIGIWWVEAQQGPNVFPRYRVELLDGICGEPNPTGCSVEGTVLFRENFDSYGDGLNPTSPRLSTVSLPAGRTTYNFTSTGDPSDGWYALAKYNDNYNTGDPYWWSIGDDYNLPNDNSIGRFMLVNADYTPKIFYQQEIQDLCAGYKLYFSAMIANCHLTPYSGLTPELNFSLLNPLSNEVIATFYTGDIPNAIQMSDWRQWGFVFEIPQNLNSVLLQIKNNQNGGGGNDLGLDNIEIRLCVPSVIITSVHDSICENASISIPAKFTNDGTFTEPLEYQWFYSTTGNLLDQTSWTAVSGNTTDTLIIDNFSTANEGYYRLAVAGSGSMNLENCRAMSEPFYLAMKNCIASCDTIIQYINDTVCMGETYTNNGFSLPVQTIVGTWHFTDTLITAQGCDSIVRLELTVLPVYDRTITASICLGDTYIDDNFSLTPPVAGIIKDSINIPTVIGGCDSIIRLHLTVNPSYYDTVIAKVCINEYYSDHGFNIAAVQTGVFTYKHEFKTNKNCDSITVLQLTVNPSYDEYVTAIIYEDEFYRIGNYRYNTPGLHISNLQTAENCDSIVNLHLDVIYYPPEITAFSPFNKDGINDFLYPGFRVQIFNRYGALIYETKTVEEMELGWDGKNSRGHNVEPGLYFYILYNSNGKPRLKSSVEALKR